MIHDSAVPIGPPRSKPGRPTGFVVALLLATLGFAALGHWQSRRLAWKEALIAQVSANTTATPLPFSRIRAATPALAYRRVALSGHYEPAGTTLVTATSDLGGGYWDMVPLTMDAGHTAGNATVWINRGFVPIGSRRDSIAATTPTAPVTLVGLLRMTEPGGSFLRANHPEQERWYSRDVTAMSAARATTARPDVFIDAQSETPAPSGIMAPVPGLTTISFPNNHLAYAITWFTLAVLSAGGAIVLWRRAT